MRIEDGDYIRIFIGDEDQIRCRFPGEDTNSLLQLQVRQLRSSQGLSQNHQDTVRCLCTPR